MHLPWFHRAVGTAAALATCLWLTQAAAQTDEQRAGARELATDGLAAFDAQNYKDAVELFRKAESLVHAPPHLIYLARSHSKLGQYVRAREAYLKVINEQLPASAPQAFRTAQAEAAQELEQIEPKIGRLTIKLEGADGVKDLVVTVDGVSIPAVLVGTAQPADPGEHTVEAGATGYRAATQKVTLADAERGSVTLKLEADPNAVAPASTDAAEGTRDQAQPAAADTGTTEAGGSKVPAYVAFGVGAVGLGLGAFGFVQWSSQSAEEDEICNLDGGGCPLDRKADVDDLDSKEKTSSIIMFAGAGLGVAGVVTGIILLTTGKGSGSKSESTAMSDITPWAGPSSVGLRGRF
jgi:hypothetical protein